MPGAFAFAVPHSVSNQRIDATAMQKHLWFLWMRWKVDAGITTMY